MEDHLKRTGSRKCREQRLPGEDPDQLLGLFSNLRTAAEEEMKDWREKTVPSKKAGELDERSLKEDMM